MGFGRIFWKNNIQEAYLPKTIISGQIVSEISDQLCSDDSTQILLNLTPFPMYGAESQKLSESQQGQEICDVIISAKHYWFKKWSTSFLKWCVERSNRIHFKIKLSPITFTFWSNHWTKNQLVHTCKIGEHMNTWIKNLGAYMGFIHSKTF